MLRSAQLRFPEMGDSKHHQWLMMRNQLLTVLPRIEFINTLRQAWIEQVCERYMTLDVLAVLGYCVQFGSLGFSIPIMRELKKLVSNARERTMMPKYQYDQVKRSLFTYRDDVVDRLARTGVFKQHEFPRFLHLGSSLVFMIPPDFVEPSEETVFSSKTEYYPVDLCSILDELNSLLSGTIVSTDMPDCLIKLLVSYVVGLDVKHMDEIRTLGIEGP